MQIGYIIPEIKPATDKNFLKTDGQYTGGFYKNRMCKKINEVQK